MVGQCPGGQKANEQIADMKMAKDGGKIEGQISAERLPGGTISASTEFKTEGYDCQRVHRRVLPSEFTCWLYG